MNKLMLMTLIAAGLVLAGCAHLPAPPPGKAEIETVQLDELPLAARFAPLGSVGAAYRVTGGVAPKARLPVAPASAEKLLPATVRLFAFDESAASWSEIGASRYDPQTAELVASDLAPGLYTAAGWSANPAANALQRILLDSTLGYSAGTSLTGLSGGGGQDEQSDAAAIGEFRRALLRGWLEFSFTYPITSCQTRNDPEAREICPTECVQAAGRKILSSCRVDGVDCPMPACCDCVTGSFTERALIPVGFLDTLPLRCPRPGVGPLCPVCPDGLSCPGGPFTRAAAIAPTLEVPDYGFLDELGIGTVTADVALRDELQNVVEAMTGKQYPVPPPWP